MPIPMIQENAQLTPTKLKVNYIFTGSSGLVITLIGIDKRGHNPIATCTLPSTSTALEQSSTIFIAIPQGGEEFPFICLQYEPVAGFRIIGTPELILDAREYPEVLSSSVYRTAELT
jgi:hypothetical protein